MNKLTATPHDHSSGAEFTYRIDGNVVAIEALQWAGRPVDKVLEQAIRKIEYFHQRPIAKFKIHYRDDLGWATAEWDGEHVKTVPVLETNE
jgi:hypothetical protein